jgi:sec-independent protein translocase protein TatA
MRIVLTAAPDLFGLIYSPSTSVMRGSRRRLQAYLSSRTAGRRQPAQAGAHRYREIMLEDLLQPRHLLVILAIALLFFGPQKLPELGKGLAQGIRGFKEGLKSGPDEPKS